MPRNVYDVINKLGVAQREKVEARAAELIAEEMTLRQLRRARKLTQQKLAKSLHIGQEGVSKLEQRTDLLISTLRSCVKGMGGDLHLVAEFPDRPPVELVGFAAMENVSENGVRLWFFAYWRSVVLDGSHGGKTSSTFPRCPLSRHQPGHSGRLFIRRMSKDADVVD